MVVFEELIFRGKKRFIVEKGSSGKRLDIFLREKLSEFTRTRISSFIKQGFVKVNEHNILKPSYILKVSDKIDLNIPDPPGLSSYPSKSNIPVKIIYEDEHIIVVYKPSGIVVHPAPGHRTDTLINAIIDKFNGFIGREVSRPGVVHRLDMGVSGIVIFAKNPKIAVILREQFASREVEKTYYAIVYGQFTESKRLIKNKIDLNPRNRKKMAVVKRGRIAITSVERMFSFENFSLLKVKPVTGRKHQIRVHLSYIGFPILNDYTYGFKKSMLNRADSKLRDTISNYEGIFLHAGEITFSHPVSAKRLTLKAEVPEAFDEVLRDLKGE